ncbi:MAG TPA: hypothetical protein ENI87_05660 [bacterium]|nr:hypothetical protein [bacterium]
MGVNDFREFWADVKIPGDGFAYSVGTIEVPTTVNAFFSGFPAFTATSLTPLTVSPGNPAAQVVILQQAEPAGSQIFQQRFLYGMTGESAHARAVHVWPAANPADTRVAICGETLADELPLDNIETWPGAGNGGSVGFIAMFDGNLNLLWSHRFFGLANDEHCAITDVSVRVEYVDGVPTTDYVTFCAASTYGMPAGNGTLAAVLPFAPPTGGSCGNPTGGDTDNGVGQWDGIVGRLSHAHVNNGGAGANAPATTVFLSAFGGDMQDGLFGIVDLDEERFAVVGSTGTVAAPAPGADLPITSGLCPAAGVAPFSAGVIAVFRGNAGSLQLEWSQSVGSLAQNTDTAIRDVHFRREPSGVNTAPDTFGLTVVGATNDPDLFGPSSLASISVAATPQATIAGGVDGFVLGGTYTTPSSPMSLPMVWLQGTFRGSTGDEGLTGISGWNEFNEHFVVTGTTDANDIDFGSYYVDDTLTLVELAGGPIAGGPGGVRVGGSGYDRPTALADPQNGPTMFHATTLGQFDTFGLGSPAGGGISVGPDARTIVVGTTLSGNFPVVGAGARAKTGTTHDAVRIAVDMVPVGVGRTDGTGTPPPAGAPAYPLPGVFGGTTPECALTPFGHQIGLVDAQAAPALARMLIDWEGPAPAPNVNGAIVVSRPPNSSNTLGAALQFDFPGNNPAAPGPLPLLPDGVLFWTTDPSNVVFTLPPTSGFALRFPLSALPAAGTTVTAQLIVLLNNTVTGGAIGPVCPANGTSAFAASPAIWLSW